MMAKKLLITLYFTFIKKLSAITPFKVSLSAQSYDNQSLQFYSESEYQMANIVKYLAMAIGILAVLFLIAGILGGRLIGL